jgi:uncharacterized tellurite resistance protein B-like protein
MSQALKPVSARFEGMQLVVEADTGPLVFDLEYLVAIMLVAIARSDGHIAQAETEKMLQLVGDYFSLKSATSIELLTRAVKDLGENPDLTQLLRGWGAALTPLDKEDIAVMLLKVVDADGNRDMQEMATFHKAAKIIDISPETLHNAFERFFDQVDRT